MAKGTDYGDDLNALLRATAGKEWRRLLATEHDSEQQRSARKKDLLRLLHVKKSLLVNGHSAADAAAASAATQDSTPAGRPPLAPRPTTQPVGSGWRQTARSTAAAKRRRWQGQRQPALGVAATEQPQATSSAEKVQAAPAAASPLVLHQPAASAPAPTSYAAPKPALQDSAAAGADYFTPVGRRMLSGPGQATQHWSALPRERISSGDGPEPAPQLGGGSAGAVPPSTGSSGGIPSLPSSVGVRASANPASAMAAGRGGLRRVLGAAPAGPTALTGGQLPLPACSGHLADSLAAPQLPSTCCNPPPLPPPPLNGADQQQQHGPRQRKWKHPQQHSNPLTRLLQRNVPPQIQQLQQQQKDGLDCEDGGGGGGGSCEAQQHSRPTRFAAEQPAAAAAVTLRPSLSLPLSAAAAITQQQHRDWGPIAGTQQHAAWAEHRAAAALEAEQLALQSAAGSDALAALLLGQASPRQHNKQVRGREQAAAATEAGQHGETCAGVCPVDQQQQQPMPQQHDVQQPRQQQQQLEALQQLQQPPPSGSLLRHTGAGGLGTNWSLPPTPSCMYSLSPDHPAAAAAPTSVTNRQQGATSAGAAGSKTPGTACGGATAGAPGCLPEFSCAADTPALLPSQGNATRGTGHERSAAAVEGPRRLFVAETPADAVAKLSMPSLRFDGHPAAAAAADAAAVPAGQQRSRAAACPPPAVPSAVPAAVPACAAEQAAGLQLHLPQPVLQVSPCADGRHLALLLGSYAPAGEPTDILVLQLPTAPEAATPAPAAYGAANGGSGLHVVASVAVQRSRWSEGLELTANCLQLASRERAGLLLILSAALELADQPTATQASILILPLAIRSSSGRAPSPDLPPGGAGTAAGARGRAQPPLAVECSVPLTCVLLDGSSSLLASGDGGSVRRLDFDPLWRTYNWARPLPAATYRTVPFEDVQQLQLYRCAESNRQLLLGLSSSGSVALWDVARSELLAARAHATYCLRSLQPVSLIQAGLSSAPAQHMAANGAAACSSAAAAAAAAAGGCAESVLHLFVGLVQHRRSREQRVAAVMLGSRGVSVSSSSVAAPLPCQQAAQQREQQQQQPTALAFAGRCCWLGTSGGDLLQWPTSRIPDGLTNSGQLCRVGCGAVSSLCTVPEGSSGGGWWQLVAATAGGSCSLLRAH